MSKQLDLIKRDMKWAKAIYDSNDELDLSLSCYLCQQTVERLCNYSFEMKGKPHIITHDIVKLCEKLKELNLEVPEYIESHADEITYWEKGSRYNINFVASKKSVLATLECCEVWLSKFEHGSQKMDCF